MNAMQPSDATRRRDRIKLLLQTMVDNREKVLTLIFEARESDDHQALGYKSWPEYVSTEYADLLSLLTREDRREAVLILSTTGMSTRAIASVVGTSHKTVVKDLQVVPEVPPRETMPESLRAVMSSVDTMLTKDKFVTGIDGKTYTRKPAVERRKPRSNPLPTRYRDGLYELDKSLDRLDRLGEEDRFAANREQLRADYMKRLIWAKKRIDNVMRDLTGAERVYPDDVKRGTR